MKSGLLACLRAHPGLRLKFCRAALAALPLTAFAAEPALQTYPFKILDPSGSRLEADVHRPPGDAIRPVVVFIHGGALMMGGRKMTPNPGSLLETLLNAGYVVVSIQMARELAAKGVTHQFITIPEGGHGFNKRNADVATRTYRQVVEFLDRHRRK